MGSTIRIKIRGETGIKPTAGGTQGRKDTLFALRNLIEKRGIAVFGEGFAREIANLESNRPVKTGRFSDRFKYGRTPPLQTQKLVAAWREAWQKRYEYIETRVAQESSSAPSAPRWRRWKRNHIGRWPYTQGPQIATEEPGRMTNYLYETVDDAFDSLTDTKHVQFSNLMVQGGWIFDPDAYPRKVSPYRNYRSPSTGVSAKSDTMSYVRRFMDYLDYHNIITAPSGRVTIANDSLLDFPREDWNRIAQAMRRIIQRQFVEPLVGDIKNEWEIKIV